MEKLVYISRQQNRISPQMRLCSRIALHLFLIMGALSSSLLAAPLDGAADATAAAEAAYRVGDRGPAGGVIFMVSANETGRYRYVEAAPEDIGRMVDADTALRMAQEYRGADFTNWRLPTSRELNEMYKYRELIGGFSPDWYWSSTRESAYGTRYQHFGHGSQGYSRYEIFNYRVRPVREFSCPVVEARKPAKSSLFSVEEALTSTPGAEQRALAIDSSRPRMYF